MPIKGADLCPARGCPNGGFCVRRTARGSAVQVSSETGTVMLGLEDWTVEYWGPLAPRTCCVGGLSLALGFLEATLAWPV